MDKIRLNRYIAMAGICSRRKADILIEEGKVSINAQVVNELGTLVNPNDKVEVEGKLLEQEKKEYIMINKPMGYVTTTNDQFDRHYVMELIQEKARLYPVGRLDMYTEGLLLITNDGDFAKKVTHPTKHVSKTYEVTLDKEVTKEDVLSLSQGIDIGDYVTRPAKVTPNKNKIIITIYEGKNRQIRKMCESLGYEVKHLIRTKIGRLALGGLEKGKYVMLNKADLAKVFE